MNYPNLPNSALEISEQPQVKEITNELLKQLQNALKGNHLFTEQVELSLKGIVRILEVLLSLDFFKNANEIDSSLRNSIEWLSNAGESLKLKMKEYERFFSEFNTSMHANEQEVTATLNANTENIKSEVKKLENQLIETTTRLLTSYQIFLNQARDNANNQITENKTQSLEAIKEAKTNANNEINEKQTQAITNINEAKTIANNEISTNKTASLEAIANAKTTANNEINANKQEVLKNITQEKQQATSEITEAKKTAFNELLETLKPKFSGLFAGVYYIRNVIYIQGGWEQKVKDLSNNTLDKSKKYEIEVFFSFLTLQKVEASAVFGLKVQEGFLKESIQKITHKYTAQTYHTKLLVENVSGVLGLYHGYFYGNINYFNEAVVTSISTKRALKGL
ncbi:MSCRAMM family adhesin SdrC [Helicobacter pylori]|nr:MSCRAMM family adhesin SdrC [Helicobacter pylori]